MQLEESGIYTIPCEVNGLKLRFIFDTGASDVHLSLLDAAFMLKNGYISKNDFIGKESYSMADGTLSENTIVNLKQIKIGNVVIKDVRACISSNINASLLLGQSAIKKIGKYSIDDNYLVFNESQNKWDKKNVSKYKGEYTGEYKNGKRHGKGRYKFPSGNMYDGEWKNDKENGYGILTWQNGDRYEGNFVEGFLDGEGIYTWSNGAKFVGIWKDGKRNGYGTYIKSTGEIKSGLWKDDKFILGNPRHDSIVNSQISNLSHSNKVKYYVAETTTNLNLRECPSLNCEILANIPYQSTVLTCNDSKDIFVKILFIDKDLYGYVNKTYLSKYKEVNVYKNSSLKVIGKSNQTHNSELEMENKTNKYITINIGSSIYKFAPHEKRSIFLVPDKHDVIFSYLGSHPNVINIEIEKGKKYAWKFDENIVINGK